MLKKIVAIFFLVTLSSLISSDYQFYKSLDESLIRDVELYDNEIYMLNLNSESFFISKFNLESKSFEIVVPKESFISNKLDDVKDMAFYNNDIYVINKNKLINVSDNFKEVILDDKYDHDISNNFYRKLHNLTPFNETLYIGSTSFEVESRDTLEGTPIEYTNSFSEVLILEKNNLKLNRVIDNRELKQKISYSEHVCVDSVGNIWFSYMQNETSSGGLVKVNKNNEVEIIDLESYSGKNYLLKPASLDFIDGALYVSFAPTYESKYLEGLSKYNISSNNWTHSIDFLTNNEERYVGRNWTMPNKTLKLNSGELVILSRELIINYEEEYYYYNIPELQKEKGVLDDYYSNLDLFEFKQSKFMVRANGIINFNGSLITSVENDGYNNIIAYPNPIISSVDYLNISSLRSSIESAEIVDITGSSLKVNEWEVSGESTRFKLPKGLSSGLHYLILKTNDSDISIKFSILK